MNIIPRRRRNELTRLGKENDLWSRFFDNSLFDLGGLGQHLPEALQKRFPPVNVAETETSYEITVELPGMEEKDIEIQLMGNNLVISGERRWEEEETTKEMHRIESEFGSFRRDVPLPEALRINADDINAVYKKGVLKVVVPKIEPTPASRIEIKTE